MKGDNDRAIQVAQSVAMDTSKEIRYRAAGCNVWGAALVAKGDYGTAIEKLRKSTELAPKSAVTWNNLGSALEDAVQKFQQAIGLDGKNSAPVHNWASVLQKAGKLDEGVQKYQKALEVRPNNVLALAGLGSALQQQGKHAEATQMIEKASQLSAGKAPK